MTILKNRLVALGIIVSLLIAIGIVFIQGLSDYDLSDHSQRDIKFRADGAELTGTLILPADHPAAPILVFVHGDGPQDRFSSGGYLPLMNALLDHGIGVYSWDKAGIGTSSGDWLTQSMDDRSVEALAAFTAVQAATEASGNPIGFIGFSQAGWVLPKVTRQVPTDTPFVLVGGATNWKQQGAYYATVRLKAEGHTDAEVRSMVLQQLEHDETLFTPPVSYDRYLDQTTDETPMSEARFHFVALNYSADSTDDLPQIRAPMLALFGEDDLNVDAKREAKVYRKHLAKSHPANDVVLWPDATHSLLKSRWFNHHRMSQIPWYSSLYALAAGRRIYAPGVIDYLSNWVLQHSQ